ncbi:hypothetical protein DXG01_003322 [Tephrocybe rancida]|nr:hypothetical protein DXG01_003322 [Tephrocybe rancida]
MLRLVAVPITLSPSPDSANSVLDEFVVGATTTVYTSWMQQISSSNTGLIDWRHALTNSFINDFRDSRRYKQFLNHRGERAQKLLDSIQHLLDNGVVEDQFRIILVVAITRLARKSGLYPTRFMLPNVTRQGEPFAGGTFGEIEKGLLDGKAVCIKIPRLYSYENSTLLRRAFLREIMPWAQLSHENVLPFYGLCELGDPQGRLGLVSPFYKNGNVMQFLKRNPSADKRSFILDAATGLAYLHDNGYVHGDIKGANILITDTVPPSACLADFGFATVTDPSGPGSASLSSQPFEGGTIQYEAPELYDPEIPHRRTSASDVYALSMASYEILTGNVPYPDMPAFLEESGPQDYIWTFLTDSWNQDPVMRPSARQIVQRLSAMGGWWAVAPQLTVVVEFEGCESSPEAPTDNCAQPIDVSNQVTQVSARLVQIFNDPLQYTMFLAYRGDAAQDLIDLLQKLLDHALLEARFRTVLLAMLIRLCRKSRLYPQCFYLANVEVDLDTNPVLIGGLRKFYTICYQGKAICLKVPRGHHYLDYSSLQKLFSREAVIWGQLRHPNILPFYGIHHLSDPNGSMCLVSPWIANGDIYEFLKTRPHVHRTPLICDVSSGMDYLHKHGVVHGDLKSLNVLITEFERACLTGFYFSSVKDDNGLSGQTLSSSEPIKRGTAAFDAPELFDADNNFIRRTWATDVYAFGMLCYEVE